MRNIFKFCSVVSLIISLPVHAGSLTLSSDDIEQGKFMDKKQEFNGFGCTGENLSPHLSWSNAPQGTKSFALTAYDPDAPTGSGWWHWQIINMPVNVTELSTNAGSVKGDFTPVSSTQINNDYGSPSFGGACPPEGHGVHRYRFTLHAISVEKLELPADASGALAGYMINAHSIESSTIESLYKRD